jgi:hypothetical protein
MTSFCVASACAIKECPTVTRRSFLVEKDLAFNWDKTEEVPSFIETKTLADCLVIRVTVSLDSILEEGAAKTAVATRANVKNLNMVKDK